MSRFYSHITSAKTILELYKGVEPFPQFIKNYFSGHKKFGSRDRRSVAALCYNYLRCAHGLGKGPGEEQILQALFLCETASYPVLQALRPGLDALVNLSPAEKCRHLGIDPTNLFSFNDECSPAIDKKLFNLAVLIQPDLFLRARRGKENMVEKKLAAAEIDFEKKGTGCFALPNATKLEEVLRLNREGVIQDYSSQQVLNYLDEHTVGSATSNQVLSAWDCCVASGGKSILLSDKLDGRIKLTVSDVRKNILQNCRERLREAGINIQRDFVADLTQKVNGDIAEPFDIVLCDAPCSGSGTWGRQPDQLVYFKQELIAKYSTRQKAIMTNTAPMLKSGGLYFYITCSVFKSENEEVVTYITENTQLRLLQQQYYSGYNEKADTMFVSVFSKD